mmetsp:Transcript_10416/g.25562  ORF Transcript_10416/g.25562 Transcript_10416/m.25562 type:complete len:129 (+) Transcript_10416:141-527(+)
MSVVYQTARTACRRWAPLPAARAAASVRCFIIPSDPGGSGQAKSVKDADRVDLWGNSYDPDSRYALMYKSTKKAETVDYQYRVDGKGFMKAWDYDPKLKLVHDPIVHGELKGGPLKKDSDMPYLNPKP